MSLRLNTFISGTSVTLALLVTGVMAIAANPPADRAAAIRKQCDDMNKRLEQACKKANDKRLADKKAAGATPPAKKGKGSTKAPEHAGEKCLRKKPKQDAATPAEPCKEEPEVKCPEGVDVAATGCVPKPAKKCPAVSAEPPKTSDRTYGDEKNQDEFTCAGEKKIADKEGEYFVIPDTRYGVTYQVVCGEDGKLADNDRVAPAYRVDVATGKTSPSVGRGYCVAQHRIERLFNNKACTSNGDRPASFGTKAPASDDPKTCASGVTLFNVSDLTSAQMKTLRQQVKCFQVLENGSSKVGKGVVGDKISGLYGSGKTLAACADKSDVDKIKEVVQQGLKDGDMAQDDKGQIALTKNDDEKKAAKEAFERKTESEKAAAVKAASEVVASQPFKADKTSTRPTGVKSGAEDVKGLPQYTDAQLKAYEAARLDAAKKGQFSVDGDDTEITSATISNPLLASDKHPDESPSARLLRLKREEEQAETAVAAASSRGSPAADHLLQAEAAANARFNYAQSQAQAEGWLRRVSTPGDSQYRSESVYRAAYRAELRRLIEAQPR